MELNMSQRNNNNLSEENIDIRPPFPPVITARDLIPTEISNKVETVRIPNAFIAYRMALVREMKSQKVACHRSSVSSQASRLWAGEPENVKNAYRKMATDAQLIHNQARGLTFFSYEQSTSTDNIMQDETNPEVVNNNNNFTTTQDLETQLLELAVQSPGNQILNSSPNLEPSLMYMDNNNIPASTCPSSISTSLFPTVTTTAPNISSFDQFNDNLGNPFTYGGNFSGNMIDRGAYDTKRTLEQRVQILEQQVALFYRLWFGGGVTNYPILNGQF